MSSCSARGALLLKASALHSLLFVLLPRMELFLKKYGVLIVIAFLAWKAFGHYRHIGPENQVLRADGKAYYAYLPAVFIYHDNQFGFIDYYEHKYNPPDAYADFRNKINGVYVNKYYAGVAILQLPFFLAAHLTSKILHLPADGYAPLYQQFFVLGGLVYLFIGMQLFLLYLLTLKIRPLFALLSVAIILLGTNAWHYSVYEQCMSHVYSLSMFGIFIYGISRMLSGSEKWIVITGFVLGMIVIIRPVNLIIVALIPFVAGSPDNLRNLMVFIFRKYKYLVLAILAALIPFIIQSLLWHWQTGKYFVYSYGEEGMEWTNPKIWHILFSYRKGWFVWTPLAFAGILGLFFFIRDWFRFFSIFIFTFLVIYVLSCWWTPDYGMGFGAREFIEFLVIPGIGLSVMLQRLNGLVLKGFVLLICFFGVYVNQVQAEQYRDHIILWDGMSKETYWRVFLQRGSGYYYWLDEVAGFKRPEFITSGIDKTFTHDFESTGKWLSDDRRTEKKAHSGRHSNYIDEFNHKSAVFTCLLTPDVINNDSLLQASVWFYGPQPDYTSLVISFDTPDSTFLKSEQRIRKFAGENHHWNQAILQQAIPKTNRELTLKVYIDNKHNNDFFYLDDFRVDFIKKR
jgi:hypothetical protein